MGRFRPRGNKTQRLVGKAVSKGLNEYYKSKRYNQSNTNNIGCIGWGLIIAVIILALAKCGA